MTEKTIVQDTAVLEALIERFQAELENLQGKVYRCRSTEVCAQIEDICSSQNLTKVAIQQSAITNQVLTSEFQQQASYRLPEKPDTGFNESVHREILAGCDVTISATDYLIAATGTCVFLNHRHPSRLITLLPPNLILIAKVDVIYKDLITLHDLLKEDAGDTETALGYFTGPSRTADIEKTLVLGVHGPKHLNVVLIEEN